MFKILYWVFRLGVICSSVSLWDSVCLRLLVNCVSFESSFSFHIFIWKITSFIFFIFSFGKDWKKKFHPFNAWCYLYYNYRAMFACVWHKNKLFLLETRSIFGLFEKLINYVWIIYVYIYLYIPHVYWNDFIFC
jgi:hypothetical protein